MEAYTARRALFWESLRRGSIRMACSVVVISSWLDTMLAACASNSVTERLSASANDLMTADRGLMEPPFDLAQVGVRDAGELCELPQTQLGQLPLAPEVGPEGVPGLIARGLLDHGPTLPRGRAAITRSGAPAG